MSSGSTQLAPVATFPLWVSSPPRQISVWAPLPPVAGGHGGRRRVGGGSGFWFSSPLANKAAFGSGSSLDFSSPFLPLGHGDDDEAMSCGNEDGGAYAFAALPDPWRQFDSSAAAPYPLPPFLPNNLVVGSVLSLVVYFAVSMVAGARLIGGGFMASGLLYGSDLKDSGSRLCVLPSTCAVGL